MRSHFRNRPTIFSVPISLLIVAASICGLLFKETYSKEPVLTASVSAAQDWIDLVVVVPILLISALASRRGSRSAFMIWLGTMLYVAYTFIKYAFGIHFNELFLVYCSILGFSFFAVVTTVLGASALEIEEWFDEEKSNNLIMAYLWIIALVFFSHWLNEIVVSLVRGGGAEETSGLRPIVNSVRVVDLAIFLPGMGIAATLLRKRHPLGYIFAPSFAVFCTLNGIGAGVIVISMKSSSIPVELSSLWLFGGIAAISSIVLLDYLTHMKSLSVKASWQER